MKRLALGQRVLVCSCDAGGVDVVLDPPRPGVVHRKRRADDGAWVALDERAPGDVHPFPADDATRSTHVLAYPEQCTLVRHLRAVPS